jgi:hypothetical protein
MKIIFMNGTEPTTSYVPAPPSPAPGIFGTKIPSGVAFAVGILLFLLPFAEVKCNGNSLANNTGLGIATGMEWKSAASGMFDNDFMGGGNSSKVDNNQKQDPNSFAIAALALGIIGLALSFTNVRASMGSALVSGVLSAGALIGLMIDLKKKVKVPLPDTDKADNIFGNTIENNMKITLDFTPWFYIAIVAFLAAAFFCYKRIQSSKR